MPEAVEVIHIFLASPGDLLDERQIARDVVDEVNECIRSLSTQIVLLGWEDTRPGVGRPQQIINKDVDRCDLFVGLMWRHWGTATGTHSSGFEEEFERARERHAITGSPEMWLSFKSIGDDHLKDPGAQLRRVIDFRQQQIDRRDFLFSDFDDSEEWKGLFRRWLLTFVLERTRSDAGDSGAIASPVRASTAVISAEPASIIPVSPVPSAQFRQVAKFINSLSLDALRIQWPDKEGPLVVAHLQVTASAAMSITYPDTHLGVHEANLLYSSRKDVILAAFERVHIIRSVVADDFRRVPGWYWFSGDIGAALFAFAADHESVAKNALDILRMAKILPAEPYVAPIISQCLRNASLREAALDYLAAVADPASIEGLAAQNDDDAAAGGLLEAAVAARLRRGDESVTEALEEMRVLSDRVKSALTEFVATASAAGLLGAVVSRHEVLRKSAIKALALGGNLVDTLSFSLLRDPSTEVRSIVYESLLAAGAEIDLVAMKKALEGLGADEMRSLVVSYYRRLPLETLLVKLEYYGEDSTEIYEAAALQYPKDFLGRVRRDLRDQMVTFQEQWSLGLRRMFSDEIAQSIEKAWADNINVVTFVRNRYTAAALRALGVGGEKGDLY
ncbi:MAG: DUF4062 domain-containing protein, partial [Acidobacteria bacterium]|nr:DUF4062 domain-containing protein [Acidobacteriota bacterium]